jgi:hypothetical protein
MAQPNPHYSNGRMTQDWRVGEVVNVGFVRNLMVTKIEPTPGDYMSDAYHLVSRTGRKYRFVPRHGLERVT